jgi:hypothetical protein
LYRCIVYAQNFNGKSEVSYQIISGWTIFEGSGNSTIIKTHREFPLFEGKLRIPQNMPTLSLFFLADWGLISPNVEA